MKVSCQVPYSETTESVTTGRAGRSSPTVYTSVVDSGVMLTLRYLVDPRHRRTSEQQIWEAILRAFKPHWDIDFAYPTQREYIHYQEHKKKPDPQEADTVVAIRPRRPSTST